ncbi:hypothetical protein LJC58_03735 [Lachnospiraceae bacterium OttesenSCG-928-D06]|nr:hypothetical protein [Lachnospiraceae bacterium OttesenSCG-928-D06]
MNKSDSTRNEYNTSFSLQKKGYQRWWHHFSGTDPISGDTRVFFIEYFLLNPALSHEEPILGQHPYNKKRGIRPSYIMMKVGVFGAFGKQLHNFYSGDKLQVAFHPFIMSFGENFYSENRITGWVEVDPEDARRKSFMCDSGYMEWDLELYQEIACHTGFLSDPFFCRLHALDTFFHGNGIKTYFRGDVILDGVRYQVTADHCNGYSDKHFGRRFNAPWLQFASNCLISEGSSLPLKHTAFVVDGCCPRFFCFPLKKRLLFQLTYKDQDYNFFFSGFLFRRRLKWMNKKTNKRFQLRLVAQDKDIMIKLSGSCIREDMLPLNYEDPDGKRKDSPVYGDGNGEGTLLIYQKTSDGKQLLDTLTIKNALFIYCDS